MVTKLDHKVSSLLKLFTALPAYAYEETMTQLMRIELAIADEVLPQGVAAIEFMDGTGTEMVLGLVVQQHITSIHIARADDGIIIANGYDVFSTVHGSYVTEDPEIVGCRINHLALRKAHLETRDAIERYQEWCDIVSANPVFARCL